MRFSPADDQITILLCLSSLLFFHLAVISNEEDVTAVTDSSGNTLRIRRDTNRMPVRVVAPDNQVIFYCLWFKRRLLAGEDGRKQGTHY